MKLSDTKKSQWLEQLFKSTHIAVLVVDKNRNNLFVNAKLVDLFGYDEEVLLHSNAEILHVNHESFLKFAALAFEFVLEGKPIGIDYQFKKKDGTIFWVHISGDSIEGEEEVFWTLPDLGQKNNKNAYFRGII